MPENDPAPQSTLQSKSLGRIVSIFIIAAALVTGLIVVNETNKFPRTDDAEVFANFIGIAPQVDGPIVKLAAEDNAFIKQGGLLFEIDPRPYAHELKQAEASAGIQTAREDNPRNENRLSPRWHPWLRRRRILQNHPRDGLPPIGQKRRCGSHSQPRLVHEGP